MKPLTTIRAAALLAACALAVPLLARGCAGTKTLEASEIEALLSSGQNELLSKTVSKPWKGEAPVPGTVGGTWYSTIDADPKSFNLLVAERDGSTLGVVSHLYDSLLDYDYVKREFIPNCASAELQVNSGAGTLSVIYTLRDDLWWTLPESDERVRVTSDDVIFWYDEIEGDPEFRSSAYNSQFVIMEDGSEARITIRKIDERRFAFDFPRIDANPLLSTNRTFGPRHVFERAKREGGVQGVLSLYSVAVNPKTIPSMGMWHIVEYSPGQRLVFARNPSYWNRDPRGASIPYPERKIAQIVSDANTRYLLFLQGKQDTYGLRPEDLEDMVTRARPEYTVFNAEGALGAAFWSFNQNPKNAGSPHYEWFTKKEFRQAMSCLVNRDRIIAQTYRGLAEPKLTFFPTPNPYYEPSIRLEYLYDPARALSLLSSIGMARGADGLLRDTRGRLVEFDLSIPADNAISTDMASIIADECSRVGITVNLRATDFQKVVEQLTGTYDWQSVMISLGSNYWPTQGSNVWPSNGNLHLWYPLQEKPATDWEARVDYLYNEGSYTLDHDKGKRIWDEYQRIILEQCPLIYLVRPRSFFAIRDRWDLSNVYFDNIGGPRVDHVFLANPGVP